MKLYGYWRSSASWRVRIALAWKGLDYEYAPVHLLKDGGEQHAEPYRQLNPLEQVPTLEFEEAGTTRRLTQSLAIIEYLDERFPDPPLLPKSPYLRAKARQLAEVVNAGIQPLQNLSVLKRVKPLDEKRWAHDFVSRGLLALELLAQETAGTYLVGNAVSMADLCLVPQLYAARRFHVDLGPLPTLVRVEAACSALPAFASAHADQQPDRTP